MNPDGFETLDMLRAFLTKRVLPALPPELVSDVRAASKLLDNVILEFDVLYPLLMHECTALLLLCEEAMTSACVPEVSEFAARLAEAKVSVNNFDSLRALATHHARLVALAGEIMMALQSGAGAQSKDILARFYAQFERQAAARLGWQSVFAANA